MSMEEWQKELNGKRVLIVDDEAEWAETLKEGLEYGGMEVVDIACSAEEAIEKCNVHEPNLVIMDIRLGSGEPDGIDIARKINEKEPRAILLITGHSNGKFIKKAEEAGFMHYVEKPVNHDTLMTQIYMAMSNFRKTSLLIAERDELQEALANRKLIDQAKGILMSKKSLTEKEAFEYLRTTSQNQSKPIVEISRWIIILQDIL